MIEPPPGEKNRDLVRSAIIETKGMHPESLSVSSSLSVKFGRQLAPHTGEVDEWEADSMLHSRA